MKRFNLYNYLVVLVLLAGVSCATLDQEPVNQIEVDGAITTNQNAQRALTGMYHAMQSTNYYGLRYLYYQDVYTDNLAHSGTFTTDQEVSFRRINPSNLQLRNTWQSMYAVIRNANFVIASAPNIENISEAQRSAIIAEARFIRAYVYFDLSRVFGAVPIVEDFIDNTDDLDLSPRVPLDQLYTFIVNDLTFAEGNLGNTANAPFRARRLAATALLARVHLQSGNNTAAAQKASEVIDSGVYTLQSVYADIFRIKGNNEMILELNFTNVDGDQSQLAISSDPATGGQKFYLRQGFFDLFQASGNNGDVRFAASVLQAGSRLRVVKYFRSATNDDNVPLIRLAEMHMIRAEANARIAGNGVLTNTQIIDDINTIRNRAGLSSLLLLDLPTNQAALTEILAQRRLEFAFEGHRYTDMQRFGIVGTLFPANEQFRVIWPIPFQEIEVNQNLTQNPGY
ncbi:RagB/SusD family nutrient uptake outer membrane protein [Belliella kenyensis]|uniref:RagB/SusD family nutrient uptake outer membrane protein n=1 Tax=Belliella kenyensis TaxID=1472724 RepID=A0ABV8ELZ3_9BACT|nr:RagB/SusD family nutrient uptake outer membrane protein [Belliella kenyensis]MCH7401294.1 RagB/SusD family nutrient uptake outer membrane protein [Belliella kenyensis]MDN3602739.1 RagB/SusD family nutrient uptake outer membrane protein [Belliella kenyensis]